MTRIIEWDAYADYRVLEESENANVDTSIYTIAEKRDYENVHIIDVTHKQLYAVPFYRR